jgi:hypothetical protein
LVLCQYEVRRENATDPLGKSVLHRE